MCASVFMSTFFVDFDAEERSQCVSKNFMFSVLYWKLYLARQIPYFISLTCWSICFFIHLDFETKLILKFLAAKILKPWWDLFYTKILIILFKSSFKILRSKPKRIESCFSHRSQQTWDTDMRCSLTGKLFSLSRVGSGHLT